VSADGRQRSKEAADVGTTGEAIEGPARDTASYVVAAVGDIPEGERLIVEVKGRSIGIFNFDGRFYALLNRCPHQGAELCKGAVQRGVDAEAPGRVRFDGSRRLIQCPWHGWEFDIATGRAYVDPDGLRVRSYAVDVEDGADLRDEIGDGAVRNDVRCHATVPGGVAGTVVSARADGVPPAAETIPVSVEDDYIVVHLRRKATAGPRA
jgi:3-phenylpropionate/trans-cinnamate dioxygenase ferredoxin subunit